MARVTAAAREVALLERAEANLRRMQLGSPHDVVEVPDVEEAAVAFEAEVRALAEARGSLRSYKS